MIHGKSLPKGWRMEGLNKQFQDIVGIGDCSLLSEAFGKGEGGIQRAYKLHHHCEGRQ
jgi:hypothetical protein